MEETVLRDVLYLRENRIIEKGDLRIRDGVFQELNPNSANLPDTELEGRSFLIPGLVDLHSDAIEKSVEPRPNTFFPLDMALRALDRRILSGGITTLFNALSFAGPELGFRNPASAVETIEKLDAIRPDLKARHRIHLRYEISDAESVERIVALLESKRVSILSFMNHIPGQGQFSEDYDYVRYLMLTYSKTEREARNLLRRKFGALEGAHERVATIARHCRAHQVPMACHDLEDPHQVHHWNALGISFAEFPTRLESARACKAGDLLTLFGAPNIIRGESSGSGVKAMDALEAGVADGICSDYFPECLLPAIGIISKEGRVPFPSAVAMVSSVPARIANLSDRGEIAAGKRADFLVVSMDNTRISLHETWVGGVCVHKG